MRSLFITATGTGLGKTVLTGLLAWQLRQSGHVVRALKPIISGYDPDDPSSDTAVLMRAQGIDGVAAVDRISPWRFRAPLSPDMAADREGRRIEFERLIEMGKTSLLQDGVTLIEGVGGAFVPLDGQHLVADWMAELGIPILLVAGSYLGTISHTLSCVEAMASRGVRPSAIVISRSPDEPVCVLETQKVLEKHLSCPVLILPRLSHGEAYDEAPDFLVPLGKV